MPPIAPTNLPVFPVDAKFRKRMASQDILRERKLEAELGKGDLRKYEVQLVVPNQLEHVSEPKMFVYAEDKLDAQELYKQALGILDTTAPNKFEVRRVDKIKSKTVVEEHPVSEDEEDIDDEPSTSSTAPDSD